MAEPFMILYPLPNGDWVFYKHKLINCILRKKSKAYLVPKEKFANFEFYGTVMLVTESLFEYLIEWTYNIKLGLKFSLTYSITLLFILMYLFFVKNNEQI